MNDENGNELNFENLLSTDLIFLDNNMYVYKNHLITKTKIPKETHDRFPDLAEDNIEYGWSVNNEPCIFGGLERAQDYIRGVI